MHIETLKIFCELADLRSFSKTGEKHLLSQSAVSQQLSQLELAYNCELINRRKRPISLTNEGQLVYDAAKEIFERYEQLKNEINTLKSSAGNRINIGAIFSIGMHALPDYIKKFMIEYPDVHVHIDYMAAIEIYELVLSGDLDVGIVATPKRDKRLIVYDFEEEPLVLVCNSNHALSGESEIDIHKVPFERFIGFEEGLATRMLIDSYLQRYNIMARPVMEFDNTETIKRAVEINSGIAILPRNTIEQELINGTLKSIRFSNEEFVRPTGIIVRKNKILSSSIKYFIKLLCEIRNSIQ